MTDGRDAHAAALAYARECGRQRQIVGIDEFAEKHGIATDALRDEVARGIAVVGAWQCGEVSGAVARTLVGADSYGDLYRVLKENGMEPEFRPAEVARWVADGRMDRMQVVEIFAIAESEVDAFVSAWLATEAARKNKF